ncbi:MAG TPA: preprotein translocase subunit YajC [Firmicutes bacterium]|nr:preprotein translocase subunit YajC [Bacillota bacterium]
MPEQIVAFMPLIIVLVVFYFFIIRPQQKQRKQRMEMLDSLRKGDKIVTIGGIHGTLTDIKEDTIRLKVGDNVELKMSREAIGYKKE